MTVAMTVIKICGVKTLDDARMVAAAGADMIGLNFYPASPRFIPPEEAQIMVNTLRAELGETAPLFIGVFVNHPDVAGVMAQIGLDGAQLSGDEPPEALLALNGRAYKAVRPADVAAAVELAAAFAPFVPPDPHLPSLLVDAFHPQLFGGTGEQASDALVRAVQTSRLMLAGGLKPENVAARVTAVQPWGVDVASGVERVPGVKDAERVRAFIENVREVVTE
ncbi:MAG: phosphoribosylanthranilate isomerase [Anaerolineae bacterium]